MSASAVAGSWPPRRMSAGTPRRPTSPVGTPMFAGNEQVASMRLNGDLFLNAVGWLVGQEELVSIRSKSVRASRAELTPHQSVQVFYLSVLVIPQLLSAIGIAVWWRRKSR